MGEIYGSSPPRFGRIPRPRSFLPLNEEQGLMATHGYGVLGSLITSRSTASLHAMLSRRPSSLYLAHPRRTGGEGDDELGDEEVRLHWPVEREGALTPDGRRLNEVLNGPQMRSMRLIGNSNPRYRWRRYWKTEEDLREMKRPIRRYYERNNGLIQQYIYIDRLLDSSLPHNLLNEYENTHSSSGAVAEIPSTIAEEPGSPDSSLCTGPGLSGSPTICTSRKVKRTPRELYKVPNEETPLFQQEDDDDSNGVDSPKLEIPGMEDDSVECGDRIVQIAIYVNLTANTVLLAGKIVVIALTSSLSVLASLVDAALDFLSTAIVWTTTRLIAHQDSYMYPVGRRRLEPIGVLVFSVIMVTSFFQVALECFSRLTSDDHSVIELGLPAIAIMSSTILVKALCWLWCRLIKNSSVQALAQDAMTDVIFNIFSIIFPIVGFYARLWWMDALGGLLLSVFVIFNWAGTSVGHIRNLTGAAATADERNVLLYLTMRFAKTIKQIQGLQAYHAGDKLNVEVDIVLDENMNLRDSHDLGESLQYVLESVPNVDRAFVHLDYASWNLPSHMQQ